MIDAHGERREPSIAILTPMARGRVNANSILGVEIINATACPACQVPLGLPCVDQLGEPDPLIHDARRGLYDDGLLAAITEMAGVAARATAERDQLIARAVDAGLSTRVIGAAASITHTSVQYIARREQQT